MSFQSIIAILMVTGTVLVSGGIFTYNRYLTYKKEREEIIRVNERAVIEKAFNAKLKEVQTKERAEIVRLKNELAKSYETIDRLANQRIEDAKKARTEVEINTIYKGVIQCLEKSC